MSDPISRIIIDESVEKEWMGKVMEKISFCEQNEGLQLIFHGFFYTIHRKKNLMR
jgi:hypothetical protein